MDPADAVEEDEDADEIPVDIAGTQIDFHDMLKAKALSLGVPIQMLRPSTFDRSLKSKEKDDFAKSRSLQDEATCAWNFFVALYYKAGGYSWRLVRDQTQPKSCLRQE